MANIPILTALVPAVKKLCSRLIMKNGDSGERESGSGRPRKTTILEDRYLVLDAVKMRDPSEVCPTAKDVSASLKERSSTEISQ